MGFKIISLPENTHVCHSRVLYADTDAGGVVYYGNYLRYFEHGRTELMRDLVTPYSELEEEGFILPVVENYCRYKASAKYDDLIKIETALVKLKHVSCRFHYRLSREEDNKVLALGFTVHAVVNRKGSLVKIPSDLYEKLATAVTPA